MGEKFNVFISFGGDKGRAVAKVIETILKTLVGPTEIFLSSAIPGGTNWVEKIHEALSENNCCLLVLDSLGFKRPWVYYEAGAAAAIKNSLILPVLFDVSPEDVNHLPVASKQHIKVMSDSRFDRGQVLAVFKAVFEHATRSGFVTRSPSLHDLVEIFDLHWDGYQGKFQEAFAVTDADSDGFKVDTNRPSSVDSAAALDFLANAIKEINDTVDARLDGLEKLLVVEPERMAEQVTKFDQITATLASGFEEMRNSFAAVAEKAAVDRGFLTASYEKVISYEKDIAPTLRDWLNEAVASLETAASVKQRQLELISRESGTEGIRTTVLINDRESRYVFEKVAESLACMVTIFEECVGQNNAGDIKAMRRCVHSIYSSLVGGGGDRRDIENIFKRHLRWVVALDASCD